MSRKSRKALRVLGLPNIRILGSMKGSLYMKRTI